jgi:Rrf2 family protein
MKISKKCQYALKAIFELASREIVNPAKIQAIAEAQGIPQRFLEAILNELKHGGFVESRRGNDGGYILAIAPEELTIGEVIEYIQGPISVSPDGNKKSRKTTIYSGDKAFKQLWQEVNKTMSEVWNSKTFEDLVEFELNSNEAGKPNYVI